MGAMFHTIDLTKLGPKELYEYEQLLRRVRSFITVKAIYSNIRSEDREAGGQSCLRSTFSFALPVLKGG
jgi:hypothetical protein